MLQHRLPFAPEAVPSPAGTRRGARCSWLRSSGVALSMALSLPASMPVSGATLALALGSLLACGAVQRPDGGTGLLPVGAPAPDLMGTTRTGERVRLSSARGHTVVVYFYPMDATPGCTREACAFRDTFDRYAALGVTIFGVSQDSAQSHRRFSQRERLPFPLVADEDGSVSRAYGVPSRIGLSSRVTFLVDGSGRVARVWPDVDPGVHANQVLAAIAELAPPAAVTR